MLDEDVVAVGMSLPHRLKTDGRRGKLVLRDLARRWLPDEVARRPKHGFSIPLDVMVPPALHRAARELLCGDDAHTRGVIHRPLVRRWLRAFEAAGTRTSPQGGAISREGLHRRVIMLLSLELWMRDHRFTW
jgi:asparagine synthase (glutamine-hydrolysing)